MEHPPGCHSRPRGRAGSSLCLCAASLLLPCACPGPPGPCLCPSTAASIWLRSAEIPSKDRDGGWTCAAGVTGKQNGGEGEHRRCGRRVNIESEGMEKSQTAE